MKRILLPASLALLALSATGQDKLTLAVSTQKGDPVHLRLTQTSVQNLESMGQEMTSEMALDLEAQVTDVAEGKVSTAVTVRRVAGTFGSPMASMEFDSDKPDEADDNPMMGNLVEAVFGLVGRKIQLTVLANGDIDKIDGLTEMLADTTGKAGGMGRMMLEGLLSEDALKKQMRLFGSFPADAKAVGETWQRDDVGSRRGMPIKSAVTLKLEEASPDLYRISTVGTLTMEAAAKDTGDEPEPSDPQAAMLKDAKVSNGKLAGNTKISRKDGFILHSESKVSMDIEMPNPMGGDEPFLVGVTQISKLERIAAPTPPGAKKPAGEPVKKG